MPLRRYAAIVLTTAFPVLSPSALAGSGLYDMTPFLSAPHPFAPREWRELPAAGPSQQLEPSVPKEARDVTKPPIRSAPPVRPLPETAAAYDGNEFGKGFYGTLNLVGSRSFAGNHEYVNGSGLLVRHDEDWVAGNSLSVGYSWAEWDVPLRTELEVGVRYRFDLDYRGVAGGITRGYENNVATLDVMVNGFYDFDLGWKWTPYLGAGVGLARHWSEIERTDFGPPQFGRVVSRDEETNNFSWAAMGGVSYTWTRHWGMRIEGRYADLGSVETGPFPEGDKITADYTTADLIIGVTYRR